jgi:NDP-sugar pyrophosphorylase family protein
MPQPAGSERRPALALLAGGLATRLRPATITTPKSMIEVAGEPFIAHQLRLLVRQGISELVICVGHLGEQIEAYVGDGGTFGCNVRYSFDGDRLLGTGGALRKALPLLGDRFFVMYGDSYLPTPFAPIQQAFRTRRVARTDDGVSQRRPMGYQQRRIRRRRDPWLRQSR